MVVYAGSPTYTAYVDMTLTRSKVKVKVTGLLNFRRLAKLCMLAAITAAPLRGFLVYIQSQDLVIPDPRLLDQYNSIISSVSTAVEALPCVS